MRMEYFNRAIITALVFLSFCHLHAKRMDIGDVY